MPIAIGSAQRPAETELVCGDACAAIAVARGVLICVADGLGHGPAAREAADAACAHVRAQADAPLEVLLRGVDRALVGSRGAAVSLLGIYPAERRVVFAGVGNVELHALARAHIASPTTPGILGRGSRSFRAWEHPLGDDDLFVLASDGLSNRFDLRSLAHLAPQAIADTLVANYHQRRDDVSCVVARMTTGGEATSLRPGPGGME
jgi:serine/threonine protein phosphatase PrpC